MTPEIVKAVVDELFAELEKRFSSRPLVSIVISTLHAAADALIPVVFANVAAKQSKV